MNGMHNDPPLLFGKLCREVNRKLASGAVSEHILDFIFHSISFLIPFERMGIALLEEDGQVLRLSWVKSKLPVGNLAENYSAPIKGSSLEKILNSGEPRILNDLEEYLRDHPHSESTKLILADGIRSSLTCPLRANNRPIGIVFFSSASPHTYEKAHIELFQDVSDELSVVVEQGRLRHLFEEGRKRSLPLARVIHDLRSPLTVIHAYIDLASHAEWFSGVAPEVKNTFKVLRRHAKYMADILSDISEIRSLAESLPGEGARDVPLPFYIAEMIELGEALAKKKDIKLETSTENVPESARFNPVQIRRVLDNLFSNAIKFSRRGTTVKFSVKKEFNHLIFSVQDEGPGIPQAEQAELFKAFTKMSPRPTEGELSTGLGLAIVKGIVDVHKGGVKVISEEGKGSDFQFWLPVPGLSREEWEQVIL